MIIIMVMIIINGHNQSFLDHDYCVDSDQSSNIDHTCLPALWLQSSLLLTIHHIIHASVIDWVHPHHPLASWLGLHHSISFTWTWCQKNAHSVTIFVHWLLLIPSNLATNLSYLYCSTHLESTHKPLPLTPSSTSYPIQLATLEESSAGSLIAQI